MDNIIAPPIKSSDKNRPIKNSKTLLTDALVSKTQEYVTTETGDQITVAQAIANRLSAIAMFAESNTDAISAAKLIYDRVQGKASVAKSEDIKPMPKVIFALTEEGLGKVNDARDAQIIETAEIEDDGSGLLVAEMDGKTFVG